MNMESYNSVLSAVGLTLMLLTGCSSMDRLRDPSYAPVEPPSPPPRTEVNGSIYHVNTNRFLFEDVKARRVGDIITVLLEEETDASKSASTTGSNSTAIDVPAPTVFGRSVTRNGRDVLVMDVNDDFSFEGNGGASQSNSISGSIAVSVVGVQSNGNLKVRGEKLLTLNNGSEVVRVTGIIRPTDISPENSVLSTQIAAAEITYSGNGFVADSNQPGWFTRFFKTIWPF